MDTPVKLSCPSHGLGDTLLLTSVCKHFLANKKKAVVSLPVKIQRFSILFDGLADVVIEDGNYHMPDIGGGHYATRKLRNFFPNAEHLDYRPLVLHSNPESEAWAAKYLADKPRPLIVVPNCAKQWHQVRSIEPLQFKHLLYQVRMVGFTPIICSNSSNPVVVDEGHHVLTDLDLSRYICLMRQAGQYFGCNTGDLHLAVAVGAECQVFQPSDHPLFSREEWDYKHPTIQYYKL